MTMAREIESQPTLSRSENSAPEPTIPTTNADTDSHFIRSNNSYPEKITYEDYSRELEERNQEIVKEDTASRVVELDQWLQFRVRSELMDQKFTSLELKEEAPQTNIFAVKAVLQKELEDQQDANLLAAFRIENETIPRALSRQTTLHGNALAYSVHDVDNLRNRSAAHLNMYDYIQIIRTPSELLSKQGDKDVDDETRQKLEDEMLFSLAEAYIGRTKEDANIQVAAYLDSQMKTLEYEKATLEAKSLKDVERIAELEAELEKVTRQRDDRDLQLLDQELNQHLEKQAVDLAA